MKFNPQLKKELNEKIMPASSGTPAPPVREGEERPEPPRVRDRPSEKVVGGDILWKPIDRIAARLLAKVPWWAQPPQVSTPKPEPETPKKRKKERKHKMSAPINDTSGLLPSNPTGGDYISESGLHIRMVGGQPMIDLHEIQTLLVAQIAKLPVETRPNVKAAEDARKIIDELLNGIGADMEKFKANTKLYLEDIRQTRFAVVTETAQMTKSLGEVRQFFLGGDYKEEIGRLREFVDLCERLQKLKACGFLDSVADTMLRLADKS